MSSADLKIKRYFSNLNYSIFLACSYFFLVLVIMFFSPSVSAADDALTLEGVFKNMRSNIGGIVKLITAGCYLGGIILASMGIFRFKLYCDNKHQNPLSNAIVLVFVGALLIWTPLSIEAVRDTMFQEDYVSTPGTDGYNLNESNSIRQKTQPPS